MSEYSRMDRRKATKKTPSERDALIEELVRDRDHRPERPTSAASGGGPEGPARKQASSTYKPKKNKRGALTYILLFLFISAIAYGGIQVYNFVSSPLNAAEEPADNSTDPATDPAAPQLPADEFAKDRINILILGVDNVNDGPDRSDTVILATLFPKEKQVKMLSLPRDTRLMIPGVGNDKLNHAYANGGVTLVKRTVEDFTKMPVDYYVETNFQGFINIIDILGGVTINVEKKMYYPDENIDLEPGLQTLDGYDSLAYVRYRSDGMGDIGRIGRQQHFLKVLAENNLKTSNILKIPELVNELKDHVKTDLSVLEMITIGNDFAKMNPSDIEAFQVPGFNGMQNEVSYWIPDLNATKKIVDGMRRPTAASEPEETPAATTGT